MFTLSHRSTNTGSYDGLPLLPGVTASMDTDLAALGAQDRAIRTFLVAADGEWHAAITPQMTSRGANWHIKLPADLIPTRMVERRGRMVRTEVVPLTAEIASGTRQDAVNAAQAMLAEAARVGAEG